MYSVIIAPAFDRNDWSYFNTGSMLMNVEALRAHHEEFVQFVRENLPRFLKGAHDQDAFSLFYKKQFTRLPIEMNWKTYWGYNQDVPIVHFHGPKPHDIRDYISATLKPETDQSRPYINMIEKGTASVMRYCRDCFDILAKLP